MTSPNSSEESKVLTSEIVEQDGLKTLRLDYNGKGVDIGMPVDHDTLTIAVEVMIEQVAGISKHKIIMAALKTLNPELA